MHNRGCDSNWVYGIDWVYGTVQILKKCIFLAKKVLKKCMILGKIILKNCNVGDMMIKEKPINVKKSHEK